MRCIAGICRRAPLGGGEIQRLGARMGSDQDGRPFSAGRSSSGLSNPGLACHERGRAGANERRIFLLSTPSCAEPDRDRAQDSGGVTGRVQPHLQHTSRLIRGRGPDAAHFDEKASMPQRSWSGMSTVSMGQNRPRCCAGLTAPAGQARAGGLPKRSTVIPNSRWIVWPNPCARCGRRRAAADSASLRTRPKRWRRRLPSGRRSG